MIKGQFSLQGNFKVRAYEDWHKLLEKPLAGRPYDKIMERLVAGLSLPALAVKADILQSPQPVRAEGRWQIGTAHWQKDPALLNGDILDDLNGGVEALALRFHAGLFPGIAACDIPRALDGVHLDLVYIGLLSGERALEIGEAYLAYVEAQNRGLTVSGHIGGDPLGILAQNGRLLAPVQEMTEKLANFALKLTTQAPGLSSFVVDTGAYHLAGADPLQELSIALSTGVYYLRALERAGLPLEKAVTQVGFSLIADADIITTIAKFRAFRRLWARVLKPLGLEGHSVSLGASSSLRMLSVKDVYVNLLRATAAGFAAAIGGADRVTLLPHDTLYGVPSAQARGLARNIQHLLQGEAGLDRVIDPSAGSYQIEHVTKRFDGAAWRAFQAIEAAGGADIYLMSGALASDLKKSHDSRMQAIRRRRIAITGISEFPDLHEAAFNHQGARYEPNHSLPAPGVAMERLPFHRDAEEYELYRLKSDVWLQEKGTRPQVALWALGPLARHMARLSFVQNLLAAIGVEGVILSGEGTKIAPEQAPAPHQFPAVFLCGADSDYEQEAARLIKSLKEQGAREVILAGAPSCLAALKEAGLDDHIQLGLDVIALAEKLYHHWNDDAKKIAESQA